MFYTNGKMRKRIGAGIGILFLLAAGVLIAQSAGLDDGAQFGTVPAELLRPRRDEPLRLPTDTVIGPMGPGRASAETYAFARSVAAALVSGNPNAQILSSVDSLFLEEFLAALEVVEPRSFRLGSGENIPDGSVSFLARFIGRDMGITGELFVRQVERRIPLPPDPVAAPPPAPPADANGDGADADDYEGEEPPAPPEPEQRFATETVWVFDDLILESPRTREEENLYARPAFDVPSYHRLF